MQKTVKNIENVVISVQKLTQIHSTGVENVRQIRLFLQNKPNFPRFSTKNEDYAKKQTQFKPKFYPRLLLTCFPVGGNAKQILARPSAERAKMKDLKRPYGGTIPADATLII